MARLQMYEDSGGSESYPTRAPRVAGAGGGVSDAGQTTETPPPQTAPPPATGSEPPPAPAFNRKYLSGGYVDEKLNDPSHTSAKYTIGRTLGAYNPLQGVTPDVLAALNKLGYGTFSGSGQNLGLSGLTDVGRSAGLGSDWNPQDFINSYKAQNDSTVWGYNPFIEQGQQTEQGVPDLSAMLASLFQGGPQTAATPPSVTMNTGIDPETLMSLLSMFQPQAQYPAQQQAPIAAGNMPQTAAPAPAPTIAGAYQPYTNAVQTQNAAQAAPATDPFMSWLRNAVFAQQGAG